MQRWQKGLLVGTASAALGVVLTLTPFGIGLEENIGLDWLFKLRGSTKAPSEIVIAAIDNQTGEHLYLSKLPREWPRTIHARLVENMTRLGAATIVFDMDFQLAKQAEADQSFGDAVKVANRVVMVEKLTGKRQPLLDARGKKTGSVWIEQLALPIAPLAESVKGLGPFPLPKVQVAIHQFWVFKRSASNAPTMPATALQVYAMPAYPILAKLIEKHGISAPKPLADSAHAPELKRFMLALRTLFIQHPELADNLRADLATSNNVNVPKQLRPLVRGLISLYSSGDQNYLNFYGYPGSITTIPYHQLAGNLSQAESPKLPDLTGKVVFVGFSDLYDPEQPDRFVTHFTNDDGVDLSGIEIAATAFANLLTDRSLKTLGHSGELMLLAVFGFCIGMMAYLLPALIGVPLTLILSASYGFIAFKVFTGSDLWLPLAIPILIQLPLALLSGLIAQYLLERRKKMLVTQAMSLYLPEKFVQEMTKKNMATHAIDRVTYSVCFASDMAGFTTIAEQMRPEELAEFLNHYFEALSGPLRKYDVDVIEFRADGIMCAWTADQPDTNIHHKAILAALEAIQAIDRFKESFSLLAQSIRIGLETGSVYVGHAGGGGHFVFSIVGDAANTAARIEGLNKLLKTQLLTSSATLEGVNGLLYRFLGEFRFAGKTEALPIMEVLAVQETADKKLSLLCERFDQAMSKVAAGFWHEAGDFFEAILKDFPDDGPSQFHLARCRRYEVSPPDHAPLIVHLDVK